MKDIKLYIQRRNQKYNQNLAQRGLMKKQFILPTRDLQLITDYITRLRNIQQGEESFKEIFGESLPDAWSKMKEELNDKKQ